jgi:hypothetical protein
MRAKLEAIQCLLQRPASSSVRRSQLRKGIMAWGNSLSVEAVQEDSRSVSMPTDWLPFDARLHMPMVKPLPSMLTITEDVPIVDERERQREEVKQNLQSIMRNRLLSETARVAAARELTRIFDNEEIEELREEVKRLTAIVDANTSDESELPPHLRRRR